MYNVVVPTVQIIYASGSGHTEYVVNALREYLKEKAPKVSVSMTRAEQAQPEDFSKGDFLILGSGTWNTGGIEGQLQPHMYELLMKRAKDVVLAKKKCTSIALGDERYYYTARAGEHLRKFLVDHGGAYCFDQLTIVNEPYGQEEKVRKWCDMLLKKLLASSF